MLEITDSYPHFIDRKKFSLTNNKNCSHPSTGNTSQIGWFTIWEHVLLNP
jgi:hypothetical protein